MNETVQVKINTPYGDTENIEIREVIKQRTTYGPIMCRASTAKVNEIGEKVKLKHCSNRGCRHNKKWNKKLQKNTIWTKKYKIYGNKYWKRETRTKRRRGEGRKD